MHRSVALTSVLAVASVLSAGESPASLPARSRWPQWRHDGHRSGRSELPGRITQPAELWRYFLGVPPTSRVTVVSERSPSDVYDLDGQGALARVQVAANVLTVTDATNGGTLWKFDLKPRDAGYHAPLVADFDPERGGLEAIVWPVDGNYFEDNGDVAYCFSLSPGAGIRSG